MQYLRFHVGYGWWTPAASKAKPLMNDKVRHEHPKKGLHDVRSFIGTCNFYRHHIKGFTYIYHIYTIYTIYIPYIYHIYTINIPASF